MEGAERMAHVNAQDDAAASAAGSEDDAPREHKRGSENASLVLLVFIISVRCVASKLASLCFKLGRVQARIVLRRCI